MSSLGGTFLASHGEGADSPEEAVDRAVCFDSEGWSKEEVAKWYWNKWKVYRLFLSTQSGVLREEMDQGKSICFLTRWVNWPGHSMIYFLCIFLCLLSLCALFVTVISVYFLASFFQAVWPIPYLNFPLPVMKVSVLLEWIRKDHHRDNFSSGNGSYMQEAISVDILCSHTVGISVLKGSQLLLIHLRVHKR